MKLTELHIDGYRSLVNVTLPLRNLMVMIGPNGSGKTALLEVFLLLKYGVEKQLMERLQVLGGLSAVISQMANTPERLKISLSVEVEGLPHPTYMKYSFELAPRGTGYEFPFEQLMQQENGDTGKAFNYIDAQHHQGKFYDSKSGFILDRKLPVSNQYELAFPQLHLDEKSERLRNLLSGIGFYSSADMNQRVARLPQPLTPARQPGPNGENLYSALYNLRIVDTVSYNRIIETLQVGFPGFEKLEFPVVGAGQVTMAWYQKGIATPFYPNQLSEGTLRFIWLATILLSPDTPSVILIDEPEVSLHPELIRLLAGLLQDSALHRQIVVATHSPDLIGWLEPGEVLAADKDDDGATTFTWADSLNLQEWLKDYTLRDLWLMGNLGGRP